jgi:hypothetical protein
LSLSGSKGTWPWLTLPAHSSPSHTQCTAQMGCRCQSWVDQRRLPRLQPSLPRTSHRSCLLARNTWKAPPHRKQFLSHFETHMPHGPTKRNPVISKNCRCAGGAVKLSNRHVAQPALTGPRRPTLQHTKPSGPTKICHSLPGAVHGRGQHPITDIRERRELVMQEALVS